MCVFGCVFGLCVCMCVLCVLVCLFVLCVCFLFCFLLLLVVVVVVLVFCCVCCCCSFVVVVVVVVLGGDLVAVVGMYDTSPQGLFSVLSPSCSVQMKTWTIKNHCMSIKQARLIVNAHKHNLLTHSFCNNGYVCLY